MAVTVFGKLPSQGDFFRHGASPPAVHEAERWLTESYEALRGAGQDFPDGPMVAVLSGAQGNDVVVTVAVPSRDSVGRSFPIVGFTTIPKDVIAGRGWAIPVLFARYVDTLQRVLIRASSGGSVEHLISDLATVPEIGVQAIEQAEATSIHLVGSNTVQAFEARCFSPADRRFYAYRTLRMACDQARAAGPTGSGPVLSCPIGHALDVILWSGLASRLLGWSTVLPMAWIWTPAPRMVMSLGTLPAQALRFLVDIEIDDLRYWPLTTARTSAIASARQTLESMATWDHQGEPLSGLMERVATFG